MRTMMLIKRNSLKNAVPQNSEKKCFGLFFRSINPFSYNTEKSIFQDTLILYSPFDIVVTHSGIIEHRCSLLLYRKDIILSRFS